MVALRILILEDSQSRIESFKKTYKHHNLSFAETHEQAIKMIEERFDSFDIIFLGGDRNCKTSGKDWGVYHVAKYLTENPGKQPVIVVLHTGNELKESICCKLLKKNDIAVTQDKYAWNRNIIHLL